MYRRALAKPEEWGLLRRVIGMAMVAFLLTGALTLPEVWAATYYVNAGTGSDTNTPAQAQSSASPWQTLTHALGQVSSGDIVSVAPGTYDVGNGEIFPLALQDGVKIEGAGPGNSILIAPAGTDVFENVNTSLSSNTTLTGFTLQHSGPTGTTQTLIDLRANNVSMSPVIDGNEFKSSSGSAKTKSQYDVGIRVGTYGGSPAGSFTGTISNNTFSYFDDAISLSASLSGTSDANLSPKITGNHLDHNDEGVDAGLYMDTPSGHGLTFSPEISGNGGKSNGTDVGLYTEFEDGDATVEPLISGNTFSGTNGDSILLDFFALSGSSNAVQTVSPTIENNMITGPSDDGVEVSFTNAYTASVKAGAKISGNFIKQAGDAGVEVNVYPPFVPHGDSDQLDFTIANNTVQGAADDFGIALSAFPFPVAPVLGNSTVTITGNTVSSAASTGIADFWYLYFGGPCCGEPSGSLTQVISGNTVTNSDSGINATATYTFLTSLSSASLDLHDNVVQGNTGDGIDLLYRNWPSKSPVTASCNTVAQNGGDGFYIGGSAVSYSESKTPDLGGGDYSSPGNNTFMNNNVGNGGYHDLHTNTSYIYATDNWWGTTSLSTIQSHIQSPLGPSNDVDVSNFLSGPPSTVATSELTASVSQLLVTYTDTLNVTGDCGCASTTFTAPTPPYTSVVPGSVSVTGGTLTGVQSLDPLKVAIGEIDPGSTVTVEWQVKAPEGYNGAVREQGTLACSQIGNVASDDPSTTPSPDPTVVRVGHAVTEIPTLDGAGLIALFGLLFLAGLFLVRRKKNAVALLLMLGVMGGLALPARAASTPKTTPSLQTNHQTLQSRKARVVMHAVTLSQVATQGHQVHLVLSDGTSLTVHQGRIHVVPMRPDKSALHAMSRQQRHQWLKQRERAARSGGALTAGQPMLISVRYGPSGHVRRVYAQVESSLTAAKAALLKGQETQSLRSKKAAARSAGKAAPNHWPQQ